MAIEFNNRAGVGTNRGPDRADTREGGGVRRAPTSAGDSTATDTVNLTSTAERLKELEASMAEQPAVDPHRVEEVRQAIDDGTFEVNAERIANQLIETENLLASSEDG
jgi:negative regulator of flagellin synthesis FlgM